MILRSYLCGECGYGMEVELRAEQWDQPPPDCPVCATRTYQEFVPPAIGGSNRSKATDLAHKIAQEDYGVSDIRMARERGDKAQVRFKDATQPPSTWGAQNAALEQAIALGRENRLRYGSGLEVLQRSLKDGTQPDLIEVSKRRSAKVW